MAYIAFLLLIFFLLSATIPNDQGLNRKLPPPCYCKGHRLKTSSDNPSEAVISLSNDNLTSYSRYIKVQDELTKAYFELRSDYCKSVLNKPLDELSKEDLQKVKDAYPFILSEAIIQ